MSVSRLTIAKIDNNFLKLNNPKKKKIRPGHSLSRSILFYRKKRKPHSHLAMGHYPSRSAKDLLLTKRGRKEGMDWRIVRCL